MIVNENKQTKNKNVYDLVFAIIYISGECWSGAPGTYDLNSLRPAESCIAEDYHECGKLDRNCIGEQWTNFVFELGEEKRYFVDFTLTTKSCLASRCRAAFRRIGGK